MSEQNHPNLHAAGLLIDVIEAVIARGRGNTLNNPVLLRSIAIDLARDFVEVAEAKLDEKFGIPESNDKTR